MTNIDEEWYVVSDERLGEIRAMITTDSLHGVWLAEGVTNADCAGAICDLLSERDDGVLSAVARGVVDALAEQVREGFTFVLQADDGPYIKVGVGAEDGPAAALDSLVAIAEEQADSADEWREEWERADARVAELEAALAEIQGVCRRRRTSLRMDGTEVFSNPTAAQIISIARAARAAVASPDQKEGT